VNMKKRNLIMHRSHNRVIGPSLGERSYRREEAGGSVKTL
jgi:hypothetical protein